jgi:hypothetical protein
MTPFGGPGKQSRDIRLQVLRTKLTAPKKSIGVSRTVRRLALHESTDKRVIGQEDIVQKYYFKRSKPIPEVEHEEKFREEMAAGGVSVPSTTFHMENDICVLTLAVSTSFSNIEDTLQIAARRIDRECNISLVRRVERN